MSKIWYGSPPHHYKYPKVWIKDEARKLKSNNRVTMLVGSRNGLKDSTTYIKKKPIKKKPNNLKPKIILPPISIDVTCNCGYQIKKELGNNVIEVLFDCPKCNNRLKSIRPKT